MNAALRVLVPLALCAVALGLWEWAVWWFEVPKFVLPPPSLGESFKSADGVSLIMMFGI